MNRYFVTIIETRKKVVEVWAHDKEDAERIAEEKYADYDPEYELNDDYIDDFTFVAEEE